MMGPRNGRWDCGVLWWRIGVFLENIGFVRKIEFIFARLKFMVAPVLTVPRFDISVDLVYAFLYVTFSDRIL